MWIAKRIVTGLDFKLSIILTAIMFFLVNGSVSLGFASVIIFFTYTIFTLHAIGRLKSYAGKIEDMTNIAIKNGANIKEPSRKSIVLMEITASILLVGELFGVLMTMFNPVPQGLLLAFVFFSSYGVSAVILASKFTDHFVKAFNRNLEV